MSSGLRDPKLSHHKKTARGYITWKSKRFYVGPWPANQAQAPLETITKYAAKVRELRALEDPSQSKPHPDDSPTVMADIRVLELVDAYLVWAESHYHASSEAKGLRCAMTNVLKLFGDTRVCRFSPKRLIEVRNSLLVQEVGPDGKLKKLKTRQGINKRMKLICRMFRWGVEAELCPADVYQALRLVSPLRKGHTTAPESTRKTAVPDSLIDATLPHLPAQCRALVELGRICGARPSEMVRITTGAIDQTDPECWFLTLRDHKTANRNVNEERHRAIPLGPKCQAILKPWLRPDEPNRYLFSPKDRMEERRKARRLKRVSRVQPSQENRALPNPKKTVGDRYSTQSLAKAIRYACESNGLTIWSPGALRKNAAQEILRHAGFESARAALGHRTGEITREHYLTSERSLAKQAGLMVG